MRTVWVVQGSRNGEWLLIHFPARRAGVIYTAVMAKPTRTMASGQPKKKMLLVWTKQEIRTKNCTLLLYHIELLTNLI